MSETCINKNNLSKYIQVFEDKKLVTKDKETGILKVNDIILPIVDNNEIDVSYILIIE
jgi:selenophosphate synthase